MRAADGLRKCNIINGVQIGVVVVKFKMQVIAGGTAGIPHLGDGVAGPHLLAVGGGDLTAVGLQSGKTALVGDGNVAAQVGAAADSRHRSVGKGADDRALRPCDIQAVVEATVALQGVAAAAEQ